MSLAAGTSFDRSHYPDAPGVYLMRDSAGKVIYVGKASSLRKRLSQYFGKVGDPKTRVLVSQIASIEVLPTASEAEALILESNMIKGHQPKYNLTLKDSRHFSYLAITGEEFPRLLLARRNSSGAFRLRNARFFGPFVEGSKRAVSARFLRKLFRIRICGKMPKKECLQYHIGNCDAPCAGRISREDYARNAEALAQVLEGKGEARRIISSLEARMKAASDALDFERAAALRDQMAALRIFFDRQRVEMSRRSEEDFIAFRRIGGTLHVRILRSRNGVIGRAESHALAIKSQEGPEINFCLQYYRELPNRVYADLPEAALDALNSALGTGAFRRPGKEKAKVLDIASQSITFGGLDPSVIALKKALSLENDPITIEAFDISTLFGEDSVGSMSRFVNGKPDKKGYRRFMIKTVDGQDDCAMMGEVVFRRYSRLLREGAPPPDLVLIDGGAGQLHAAMQALDRSGVRLPVAALAKREEEIYLPERMRPARLPRSDAGLRLLQRCRDEAHRFAVSYQRLRRAKRAGV